METDTNLEIAGVLADLAYAQPSPQKRWGYKQAASAIRDLDRPVERLVRADGTLDRIVGIGPASTRVILDVLEHGYSPLVEQVIAESDRRDEILERRQFRARFLSAARVREVLDDTTIDAVGPADCRADFQMHSTWSDGSQTLDDIVATGIARGYTHAAVTDHSGGLPIARGLSAARFAEQWAEIDALNAHADGRFRLLKGVEANIRADGTLDVDERQRAGFDIVVAAPHAALRLATPQTERMIAAVRHQGVHVLGHPRGRIYGSRPGIAANWPAVFEAAARENVAVEIDGDPFRQDLDYELAGAAAEAGCLFALDSDAHATDQWHYTKNAIAHARLAGIPAERVINCWPLDRLLDWAKAR